MSKATRQRTARDRFREERERQAKRQQRTRALAISLGALGVVAAVVAAFIIVDANKDAGEYAGVLAPVTRQPDGSVVMAKPGVQRPVLDIFADFQCPACKKFEELNVDTVKRLAAEGKVKVVFRPFQLFEDEPLKSNSRRAANAALCTPASNWLDYHDKLFTEQPLEGQVGFSNDNLVEWGGDVGVNDPNFERCVTQQQKGAQVDQMTRYAKDKGVSGTPTLMLNGTPLTGDDQVYTVAGLEKAILNVAKNPSGPGDVA